MVRVEVVEEGAYVVGGGVGQLELVKVQHVEGVVEDPAGDGQDVAVGGDFGFGGADDQVDVSEELLADEDLVALDEGAWLEVPQGAVQGGRGGGGGQGLVVVLVRHFGGGGQAGVQELEGIHFWGGGGGDTP